MHSDPSQPIAGQTPPGIVTPPAEVDELPASNGGDRGSPPPSPAPPPVHKDRRHRAVGWQSKDVLRTATLVVALYLVLRLLWFANQLVLTTFLGVLFGLAVSSGVDRLQRLKIPRGVAAGLIVIAFYGGLALFGVWMAPTIREQGIEVRRRLPIAADRLEEWINRRPGILSLVLSRPSPSATNPLENPRTAEERQQAAIARAAAEGAARGATTGKPLPGAPSVTNRTVGNAGGATAGQTPQPRSGAEAAPSAAETLRERLGQQLSGAGKFLFPFLSSTLAVFAGILLITFLAIYIAADPKLYHDGLMHLFPRASRARAGEVLTAVATVLRKWLVTQLIAMTVIGAVTTIALLILRVKAAFALGLLAGLLEFIPTIGPILSSVPAIAMAFVDSPEKALTVAAAYIGIQFLENHILIPMLMKGGIDLPPALTVLSQALLAILFGFLGLMVAVPLLAAVMVSVKMLYVEDVVGDSIVVMDEEGPRLRGDDDDTD